MSRQQIVVIHGGDSFPTYREYLRFLRTLPVSLDTFASRPGWKADLPRILGRGYSVVQPKMPNPSNARYREWAIWFTRMLPYLNHNVILVGHSQGGIFLLKYLSAHTLSKKIRALVLVAPPHSESKGIGDFRLDRSLRRVARQCPAITFFYSPNDPIVPFREMKKYQTDLPAATFMVLKNRGHFSQPRFPELVRLIRSRSSTRKK